MFVERPAAIRVDWASDHLLEVGLIYDGVPDSFVTLIMKPVTMPILLEDRAVM